MLVAVAGTSTAVVAGVGATATIDGVTRAAAASSSALAEVGTGLAELAARAESLRAEVGRFRV